MPPKNSTAEGGLQFGVLVISAVNAILMYVPVLLIDERQHVQAPSSSASILAGMRHCASNRHFRACTPPAPSRPLAHPHPAWHTQDESPPPALFSPRVPPVVRAPLARADVMADFAFFYASAMIQTALPFYLTVCGPSRSKAKSARRQ